MNQIRKIREKKKVSQMELARAAGVSQPYMSDLENNRRGARPETYQKIADFLGVEVSDLMKKAG